MNYSHDVFVLTLHPKLFFGQIWFQELKFSKLAEIKYKRTLLYPYSKFHGSLFKIFASHVFLGRFGPII